MSTSRLCSRTCAIPERPRSTLPTCFCYGNHRLREANPSRTVIGPTSKSLSENKETAPPIFACRCNSESNGGGSDETELRPTLDLTTQTALRGGGIAKI